MISTNISTFFCILERQYRFILYVIAVYAYPILGLTRFSLGKRYFDLGSFGPDGMHLGQALVEIIETTRDCFWLVFRFGIRTSNDCRRSLQGFVALYKLLFLWNVKEMLGF